MFTKIIVTEQIKYVHNNYNTCLIGKVLSIGLFQFGIIERTWQFDFTWHEWLINRKEITTIIINLNTSLLLEQAICVYMYCTIVVWITGIQLRKKF